MGDRYLHDLADVCRTTGYPVVEVDNWQNRARGSGGYDSGRPTHVMIHHTASGPGSDGWPDVNYCCYGDDDAPLANLYLSRDGTVYVMAAGATNTNGSGHDPCGITADDSMNSSAIGIEAGNDGTGEAWPDRQQDAYTALCGALCAAYGIGVDQIHSHAEWAPTRKVDPAGPSRWATSGTWDEPAFRADVTGEPPPPPPIDLEENAVKLFVCPGDPGRPAVLLGAGWRKTAKNEEETQVFENAYGPGVWLDARNYDVISSIAAQTSDGW